MKIRLIVQIRPRIAALLACATVASGCASTYEPSSASMDADQARQTLQRLLPGQIAQIKDTHELIRAITEVRIRPDGIGLLWTQARDLGFWSGVAWDNPKTLKICYFAQSTKPVVTETMGAGVIDGLCDIEITVYDQGKARLIADAVYVLEQQSK